MGIKERTIMQAHRCTHTRLECRRDRPRVSDCHQSPPGPIARAMNDPQSQYLASLSAGGASPTQIVENLFSQGQIFSLELNALTALKARTSGYLEQILREGVEATTLTAIAATSS